MVRLRPRHAGPEHDGPARRDDRHGGRILHVHASRDGNPGRVHPVQHAEMRRGMESGLRRRILRQGFAPQRDRRAGIRGIDAQFSGKGTCGMHCEIVTFSFGANWSAVRKTIVEIPTHYFMMLVLLFCCFFLCSFDGTINESIFCCDSNHGSIDRTINR